MSGNYREPPESGPYFDTYNDDPPWDRPQTEHESSGQQIDRLAALIMDEVPSKPSRSEGAVDTAIRIIRGYLNASEVEWPWPADRQPSGAVEDPANPWNRGFNEALRQCRAAYRRAVRQPRIAAAVETNTGKATHVTPQKALAKYIDSVLMNEAWAETGEEVADYIVNCLGWLPPHGPEDVIDHEAARGK